MIVHDIGIACRKLLILRHRGIRYATYDIEAVLRYQRVGLYRRSLRECRDDKLSVRSNRKAVDHRIRDHHTVCTKIINPVPQLYPAVRYK